MAMAAKHSKIKLREVNRHLVCRLCRGYYIDATTIVECLHSFCRSCIIKYLEKNSFCPICEVQIHKTKPYLNLRLDKALQDVVYKLVPGLYHDEMKRRREFYAKHQEQIPITTPEQCGLEERLIFSPDDSISLSLEYLESDDFETETVSSQSSESGDNPDGLSFPQQLGLMKLKNSDGKASRRESQDIQESSYPKRYLQCPAVVSIFHLKKFIRMKHELTDRMQVDIVHKRVPLPDHYTLMDVAYIYTWKRSIPMRFFYQICETKKQKIKMPAPLLRTEELQNVNGLSKPINSSDEAKPESRESGKSPLDIIANGSEVKRETKSVSKAVANDIKQTANISVETTANKNEVDSESREKSEALNVNGISDEIKKKVETNRKDDKIDKSDLGGLKTCETPRKDEKTGKSVVKQPGAVGSDENATNSNSRLLLNPISGQLESVPSANQIKVSVNGEARDVDKKEAVEGGKKCAVTDPKPKKGPTESQKEVNKSSVNSLKNFRKEKGVASRESKTEMKSVGENSLIIKPLTNSDKSAEKKEKANGVSVEVKADKKESEYDFDGTSPPSKIVPLQEYSKMTKQQKLIGEKQPQNSWMSLQDFRMQMLKESVSDDKKDKRKSVPSLFRITGDGKSNPNPKTPNGKASGVDAEKTKPRKSSPTIIHIKTESEDSKKTEIKIELPAEEAEKPPKPIKIESKGGEYVIKQREDDKSKEQKSPKEEKKPDDSKVKADANKPKDGSKGAAKRSNPEKPDNESTKKPKLTADDSKNDHFGAIDLSKTETSPRSEKNPLENLIDLATKSGTPKSDENMVEALISAAQKQSIEPLLKIPQYCQNSKNSSRQDSPPLSKNISSTDISQALQFFKDLRSDIKVLEAKSQLSPNSFLEQFAQKTAGLEPIQLYQQHIDLIRRLKRQQMAASESEISQRKQPKLSPPSDSKKKLSPESKSKVLQHPAADEAAALKSSIEKTLSQIQEQMEIQSRMVAAQSYKNLPALLQFYNRPPAFCSNSPSPPKTTQSKIKSSSHSPNSQKSPNSRSSPQGLTAPSGSLPLVMANSDASFFAARNYNHLINAGLNSEMTFHQMFQNYLNQQDKMNQIKHGQATMKKPAGLHSAKTISELYYGAQASPKKQEPNSVPLPWSVAYIENSKVNGGRKESNLELKEWKPDIVGHTTRAWMQENCEKEPILMDGTKRINGSPSEKVHKLRRLNVAELNSHLLCALCNGYYVEATAIIECLHTFCRSCIVKYLTTNGFCPTCDVQIYQKKPWKSLRPDKTLQDLVYKLVPGLYQDEMRRRRKFYADLGIDSDAEEGDQKKANPEETRFYSLEDSISLSLEYYSSSTKRESKKSSDEFAGEKVPKRYLQCPAAVTVRHLKKFVRMKYGIGLDCWIDIIYDDECLPEDFSLIDVAYTFTWKRKSPMRFAYRIRSKSVVKKCKSPKSFQKPLLDETNKKKSKNQPSLDRQKQNEYLGNFNLNPTNSNVHKSQNNTKTKNNSTNNNANKNSASGDNNDSSNNNNNNNNDSMKNHNTKKCGHELVLNDLEDVSNDKMFQSSEDSNVSGLQIIEKEESLKATSEDSQESVVEICPEKSVAPVMNFEEEAVDGFSSKKVKKSKHKSVAKSGKRKSGGLAEKRRRSAVFPNEFSDDAEKAKSSAAKRRKSMADEYSLKRDEKTLKSFTDEDDMDSLSNLKNEALRKVFVTKDKTEICGKRNEGEFRRKKRKKSKHHENEAKRRKSEMAPSIMSFAKDALKLKVKLTPNKPVDPEPYEVEENGDEDGEDGAEEGAEEGVESDDVNIIEDGEDSKEPDKGKANGQQEAKTAEVQESRKSETDKERLMHLRAVRHKAVLVTTNTSSEYINTPPSLTISKISSNEQQAVKSTLVESRPSLEIMLVSPTDNSKGKKADVNSEATKDGDPKKVESSSKDSHNHGNAVDFFGVLDLSEKSTRTKETSSTSSPAKDIADAMEKCRKSTHQSILQIAQTLVNRNLPSRLPESSHMRLGSPCDSSATAAAMRNLKTLSDTAVNILMAAQNKNFQASVAEAQKLSVPFVPSSVVGKALANANHTSTKTTKDCENGPGLKIPTYPPARDRSNPIPPVPNLHEIFPRNRGRLSSLPKPTIPTIKPGQNQTVRQIPNPFVIINRQTNQNLSQSKPASSPQEKASENADETFLLKQKINSIPPLQSIKTKLALPKTDDHFEENGEKNGSADLKEILPKLMNNNITKAVQNGSDGLIFDLKNGGDEKKPSHKLNNNSTRTIEHMARNIESVAAGLTARAVSNAMIDAK